MVGKPAAEGSLKITPALDVETCWKSTTELEVSPTVDAAPRVDYLISYTKGDEQYMQTVRVNSSLSLSRNWHIEPFTPIFFTHEDLGLWDAPFKEAVKAAYYVNAEDESVKIPAKLRQATVGDVKRYPKAAEGAFYRIEKEELEEFSKFPDDKLVPNLWIADPYLATEADQGKSFILMLPNLGYYDNEKKAYSPLSVANVTVPRAQYSLKNKQIASGVYQVTLSFHAPVVVDAELKDLLDGIEWSQYITDDKTCPVARDGDLSFKSKPVDDETFAKAEEKRLAAPLEYERPEEWGEEMRIALDVEKSAKSLQTITLPDGKKVKLIDKLVFMLNKGYEPSSLGVSVDLATLIGKTQMNLESARTKTALSPDKPWLASDITLSTLSSEGKRDFAITYNLLENPTLRVMEFENKGESAARVIAAYENYYSPQFASSYYETRMAKESRGERPLASRSLIYAISETSGKFGSIVPTELLEMKTLREISLPQGDQDLRFSLRDERLFPDAKSGLYLVEMKGELLPDVASFFDPDDKLANLLITQGVIQVTDIGMFWQANTSKEKLFVYGFSLSTGKELPKARLSLYSKDARLLHEQDISPMGSMLDLAKILGEKASEVAYLSLSTEDDSFTTPYDSEVENHFNIYSNAKEPSHFPVIMNAVFTDRPIYRPGETAHVKGFIRQLLDNELSIPSSEFISGYRLSYDTSEGEKTVDVKVEKDGSFSCDIVIPESAETGQLSLHFEAVLPLDATYQSPDLKSLGVHDPKSYEAKVKDADWAVQTKVRGNREFWSKLEIQHYRRSEFEITEAMKISDDAKEVTISVDAQQLNGAPLANAEATWSLTSTDINFYPAGLKDYRFGNYLKYDEGYFNAYYWNMHDEAYGENWHMYDGAYGETHTATISATRLDAQGKGSVTVNRPSGDFPSRQRLLGAVSVTNGNEQRLSGSSRAFIDPAELYIGLRQKSAYSQKGDQGLSIDLLSVNTQGKPTAAPHPITVKVSYETTSSYSYGGLMQQMLRHSSETVTLDPQTVTLNEKGEGSVTIPTKEAGVYTIVAEGLDAKGCAFRTAIRHHVYGEMEKGRGWKYESPVSLSIVTDKEIYQPNEKVKLLLKSPVDGEILVSVHRDNYMRQLRQKVDKDNPVIELDLLPEDTPGVTVEVFLVQGGEARESGKPKLLSGRTSITIDPVDKRLKVTLDLPEESVLPGTSCTLSGQVLAADGKPASHATVTLYAEDEGSLQAGGYKIPNPLQSFYSWRSSNQYVYGSLGNMLSEDHKHRYFGNKGVFIGGGGLSNAVVYFGGDISAKLIFRENFNPCALWLGQITTDAEGRFSTEVKNPDTLTRYRVIAVAAHEADEFGVGSGHYQVNKPIMLEPSAPLSACKGDIVNMPVTVTMLPDELPEELKAAKSVSWKVQLKGSENVDVIQPMQTVTLDSNAAKTLYFPVNTKDVGTARFEWSIVPAEAKTPEMLAYNDAIAETFTVRPATPYLRENLFITLAPGSDSKASSWLKTEFDLAHTSLNLTLSPSPISAYTNGIDMLNSYPYSCTEQLSSRAIPLIYAEDFHLAAGAKMLSKEKNRVELRKIAESILKRRIDYSSQLSYWDDSKEGSQFSAYAYLVLTLAAEKEMLPRSMQYDVGSIGRSAINDLMNPNAKVNAATGSVLWLYAEARRGRLTGEDLVKMTMAQKDNWTSPQENLMLMHLAQMLAGGTLHDLARAEMNAITSTEDTDYSLPSVEMLKLMIEIEDDPTSDATASKVAAYVGALASQQYTTTLENAWTGIMLAHYIEKANLTESKTNINGQDYVPSKVLSYYKAAIKSLPSFKLSADSGKAYATVSAEGFLKKEQPEQLVDKGFHVQRRYEKLLPDGKWQPTAEFTVGDTVRVTIEAIARQDSQYVALEDYLPAGMEAVNPSIIGQALPDSIMQQRDQCWFAPYWVTRQEFLKDRVRFFMNSWSVNNKMTASYIAIVKKSGEMKAPAAKAEAMYKPEHYGLAMPLKVTIKP